MRKFILIIMIIATSLLCACERKAVENDQIKIVDDVAYWTEEMISPKQFMETYQELTGWDFKDEENEWYHTFEKMAGNVNSYEEAYNLIEKGDWSIVVPFDRMETLMNAENPKWCRADVNGDGMPELISQYGRQWSGGSGLPIEYIFAFDEGKVELVFTDLNDYTEYYFLGSNGNLIYDYNDHGQISHGYYPLCQFDENWNIAYLEKLEIYYFYDEDTYGDEEIAHLKEYFPDTYGTGGHGFYCFRSRPQTEEELESTENSEYWFCEPITIEEFLEAYQQMTGFDFLERDSNWQSLFAE